MALPRKKIRQARRRKRAEKNARGEQRKADGKSLGGSEAEEARLYEESYKRTAASRKRAEDAYQQTGVELNDARNAQKGAKRDYDSDLYTRDISRQAATDGIADIGRGADAASRTLAAAGGSAASEYTTGAQQANAVRSNALSTNSLVGSTDSILAQRQAQIGQSATIGSATETALKANAANAQARLANGTQMMNRQAMGLAASQGEGGALALQSAMGQAGIAAGDAMSQNNLALGDQAAQMRFQAALAQRDQDLAEAGYASDARLGATQAERQAQLAIAGENAGALQTAAGLRATAGLNVGSAQAELAYQSQLAQQQARETAAAAGQAGLNAASGRELDLQKQRASLATGNAQLATAAEGSDKEYQSGILTSKYAADKDKGKEERSWLGKVADPLGFWE